MIRIGFSLGWNGIRHKQRNLIQQWLLLDGTRVILEQEPVLRRSAIPHVSKKQLLDWSVTVPAGMVTVTVHDQVVTLAGTVTWAFQSDAAARAVSDLRGIRAVRNRIALRVAS